MFEGKRVAVVIPAYREERLIRRTLTTLPLIVDDAIVVDDASPDATFARAEEVSDPRVRCIRHAQNRGVGAAIVTGYRAAAAAGADVVAVMAGDAQMDPADLEAVIAPVVQGRAEYVKGNRLRHPRARQMPFGRRVAGRLLGVCTSLATGLRVGDSQCGYTAIAGPLIDRLDLDALWPRYGYPNDLLALVARASARVVEVPVRPIYAGEQSGVRPWHVLVILGLLARRRLCRLAPGPRAPAPSR